MKPSAIILWVIRLLLLWFAVNEGLHYFEYQQVINNSTPIDYQFLDATRNRKGRSDYYHLKIEYQGIVRDVSVTENMWQQAKAGVKHDLYYSPKSDAVVLTWTRSRALRFALLSLFAFGLTFLPLAQRKSSKRNR